jgi:signal transduction histidine kinase
MTPVAPVYFLLVDDREENLLALEALLRREGLVILKARSGPEALELLLKHDVALSLIDVQMPEMGGFELAELMRGTERTRRVPIIFVTAGMADHDRRFRGYEAGAVDFLYKPIEPDILRGKAAVFFDLYRQRQEVSRHRDELVAATAENNRLLLESQRYAQALKEADQRKDEFLAMLAHELRNPLTPIRNAAQIVQRSEATDEAVRHACEMMERQVNQMARLIDDLLDISRINRGKIELRRERVELGPVIKHAVEAVRPLTQERQQELILKLPPEAIYLDADSTRLAQIVGNLLNNASKFTDKGGRIIIAAEEIGNEVTIRVADTGIGIAKDELHRIFDLFAQIDTSLERSQNGLGIGLTLVKTLSEMHGGNVAVDSAGLGRGSEFVVSLPVANKNSRPLTAQKSADRLPATQKHRILVVDDNRDAATSLAALLKIVGQETHIAFDGMEAVAAAELIRPEVVVMDIGLPKLNGYEAARQIRQQSWGAELVLIALTGWGQDEDRRKSTEAGFSGHLVKPVDVAALLKMISELTPSQSR